MSTTACRGRGRVRTRSNQVQTIYSRLVICFSYVQAPQSIWQEWSFRVISERQALLLVAAGEISPFYDYDGLRPGPGALDRCIEAGTVQLIGYRANKPMRREGSSPCSLDRHTMDVAAMDASNTFIWAADELAQLDKFRLWPYVGDTKANCVRPRPTAIESGYLKTLLAAGRLAPEPIRQSAAA